MHILNFLDRLAQPKTGDPQQSPQSHGDKTQPQNKSDTQSLESTLLSQQSSSQQQQLSYQERNPASSVQLSQSSKNQFSHTRVQSFPAINTRPSPEDSADTIINFIDARLATLKSEGASDAELRDTLQLALDSHAKGVSEGLDIAKSYGIEDKAFLARIDAMQSAFQSGINELEQRYFGDSNATDATAIPSQQAVIAQAQESEQSSLPTKPDNSIQQVAAESISFKQKDQFNLQIKTQDGDIITLNFKQNQSFSTLHAYARDAYSYASQSESLSKAMMKFDFSVEGKLDDDELAAIHSLLEQTQAIATEFFSGDYEQAFAQAIEMEFDFSEIASFDLNLKQSQQTKIQAYEAINKIDNDSAASNNSLAELTQGLSEAFQTAKSFAEPQRLLLDSLQAQADILLKTLAQTKAANFENTLLPRHEKFSQLLSELLPNNQA